MNGSQTLPHGYRLLDSVVVGDAVDLGAATVSYAATDGDRPVRVEEYFPARLAKRADGVAIVPDAGAVPQFQAGLTAFTAAARGLSRVHDPAIVRVRHCVVANGTCYLVTDVVDGDTLAERLGDDRTLAAEELQRLAAPVLDGLAIAHRGGLLHRQIDPTTVVVRPDGTAVLTNFSLDAMSAGGARQTFGGGTRQANVKPGYAALEQYSAGGRVGPWTDVYGLGALLYRCATGRTPVDAPQRAVRADLPPAVEVVADASYGRMPAAIDAALQVAIAKRPQSVDHWRAMLLGRARLSAEDNRAGRTSARGFGRAVRPSASASTPRAAGTPGGDPDVAVSERSLPGVRWAVPALAAAGLTAFITWVDTGVLRGDGLGPAQGGYALPVVPGAREPGAGEPGAGGVEAGGVEAGQEPGFTDPLRAGGSGPAMVVVPAGTQRAACVGDACPDDGAGWREVALAAPIAMSKFEVTALDYAAFAADTGRPVEAVSAAAGRLPAVNVSWEDAAAYVAWLAAQTSKAYRLPTEAEWDYAAAGDGEDGQAIADSVVGASPVGSGPANALGLHDLHRNVSEWVMDCADAEEGPTCATRVRRGSSWIHPQPNAGAAMRAASPVSFRAADTGFRVVRALN